MNFKSVFKSVHEGLVLGHEALDEIAGRIDDFNTKLDELAEAIEKYLYAQSDTETDEPVEKDTRPKREFLVRDLLRYYNRGKVTGALEEGIFDTMTYDSIYNHWVVLPKQWQTADTL